VTGFRFTHLHLEQYRCFELLDLELDLDPGGGLTLLFAENGGGKTAVLNALAVGLTAFQTGTPRALKLDPRLDPRKVTLDERGRREPVGPCTLAWTADVGAAQGVGWSSTVNPASGRKSADHRQVLEAIEQARVPGARWPLFAFYGVDRMGRGRASNRPAPSAPDCWEGYAGSLNADQDDSALLTWLLEEVLADTVRRQEGEPERFLASAVMDTLATATPGVTRAWYDPRERSPVLRFDSGEIAPWQELSDGFHIYLALVADIARRAVILNEQDGGDAPSLVQGVVLIDEIDLHLHPRWQRVVLDGLRETFPRLQFIVTTHSPQVLSSAQNRQVRRLVNGKLQEHSMFVEGRDSNAILRELMDTNDRGAEGQAKLRALHDAIDHAYEHCVGFTSLGEMYVPSDAPLSAQQRAALILAIGLPHDDTTKDNGILNLNHPKLVAARAAAVDGERERLDRDFPVRTASKGDRAVRVKAMLAEQPLQEFISIRVGWLNRTLGRGR
jgi:predicted ATP-binding protein involved in virulence